MLLPYASSSLLWFSFALVGLPHAGRSLAACHRPRPSPRGLGRGLPRCPGLFRIERYPDNPGPQVVAARSVVVSQVGPFLKPRHPPPKGGGAVQPSRELGELQGQPKDPSLRRSLCLSGTRWGCGESLGNILSVLFFPFPQSWTPIPLPRLKNPWPKIPSVQICL